MSELLSAPAAALTSLDATWFELLFLGVVGLVVGVLAGMIGVALGIIRLPIMLAIGFNPLVSAGTNLGVSTLGGLTAAWPHWREGRVVTRVVIVFGLPALGGSFVGGLYADEVPAYSLLGVISLILAISAATTLIGAWRVAHPALLPVRHRPPFEPPDPTGVSNLKPRRVAIDGGMGIGIGVIGGAVGMVLGALRLPVLVNVLRMDPGYAAGTNNMIGVFAGAFGFAGHAINANFDVRVLAVMGVAGMIGSFVGANQTGRFDANRLRALIGLVLLVVTPLVIYRAVLAFPD